MDIELLEGVDKFIWGLTTTGVFAVSSMYLDLTNVHLDSFVSTFGKMKVPLQIIFFMWFLHRKVILIKDNLAKKN